MTFDAALLERFSDYLHASPTPYHAVHELCVRFEKAGFQRLKESEAWTPTPGQRAFYTRGGSTFAAFIVGRDASPEKGVRLVGAHTDSPCLKLKPSPTLNTKGYQQLGIEVYGGALLNPWFDRDLSLAGVVAFIDDQDALRRVRVDFKDPIAVIPNLAIHLDREANNGRKINPQSEMNPILSLGEGDLPFAALLEEKIAAQSPTTNVSKVLDFDLRFYDTQRPALIGLNREFFAGARLDNLLSTFVSADALLEADDNETCFFVSHDHEEVGSRSDVGAQGTLVLDWLARMFPTAQDLQVAKRQSLFLSIDNAHGVHPNFSQKHDAGHGPMLNAGPVLKFDANQSYASSPDSAGRIRALAEAGSALPLQSYVTRADMRCGSTIGPISSAQLGIPTVDLGVPTFAMHSVRELAGSSDVATLRELIVRFLAADMVATGGQSE